MALSDLTCQEQLIAARASIAALEAENAELKIRLDEAHIAHKEIADIRELQAQLAEVSTILGQLIMGLNSLSKIDF